MTFRQRILQIGYPFVMLFGKLTGRGYTIITSNEPATSSFFTLQPLNSNGEKFDLTSVINKKILIVNTASKCGYTDQYAGLERLYKKNKDRLMILAFPSADFKQQEFDEEGAIHSFCEKNYGISFPIMKKSIVVKKEGQNDIYSWLTDKTKNGWNNKAPYWNFCKYLIDEKGNLTHFFGPSVSPSEIKSYF